MKFLHTSDWHLGKKLNGFSRLEEQKDVLDEIAGICDDEKVDAVIIAGDVFDTFVPCAEAEELFFSALDILATPSRAVLIISGNHDDAKRLSASRYIARKSNAYIFGGADYARSNEDIIAPIKSPVFRDNFSISFDQRDAFGGMLEKNNGERVYIGALPYPSEDRFKEKIEDESFDNRMRGWIDRCFINNREKAPQILISHIFMSGGDVSDSERQIELGGARACSRSLIPEKCLYTALGHLHKPQVISSSRNIIYSGSPLAYGFDEAGIQKSVRVFDVSGSQLVESRTVALRKGKALARLVAANLQSAEQLLGSYGNSLVSLCLRLDEPLSEAQTKNLISTHSEIVELKLDVRKDYSEEYTDRINLSEKELFVEYYKSIYNSEPDNDLTDLYMSLMQNSDN